MSVTYKGRTIQDILEMSISEIIGLFKDTKKIYSVLNSMIELGLGYLALSGYLRAGVKAIIDIQNDLANARADREYARISEQSMREFIVDIFVDEEPETLNDEYKKRIRDFVGELLKEMDGDSNEDI